MRTVGPKLPFYAKFTLLLLMICLIVFILYAGRDIIMPLLISLLFALLLRPLVIFFNKKLKFPNVLAVLVVLLLFIVLIGAVIFFISGQFSEFANDLPRIKQNLSVHYDHLLEWVQQKFHISYNKQEKYIKQVTEHNGNQLLGSTLTTFSHSFLHIVLIPIYTFLILLYRNLFKKFLHKLVYKKSHHVLISIIMEVKIVIQSYIVGLLIEMGIIAVLTSCGMMIVGVQYAILLGVITAVLNLIPYIGILSATLMAIVAASINSTDLSVVLGSVAVNATVHFIDNNFLIPKIVASKVRINALASIIGVITGGLLAGIMGMFLAIPIIAIIKVIFDRISDLE
ncbi:MAG: AI-2E family transporter, partial [Bacteroidia bacterium]|nr:AI-2E family transporter [Bacteroidia bacterium]